MEKIYEKLIINQQKVKKIESIKNDHRKHCKITKSVIFGEEVGDNYDYPIKEHGRQ